jgi:hypothetical protein
LPPLPNPFSDPPYEYEDVVAEMCISPLVGYTTLYPAEPWATMVKEFYGTGNASLFAKAMRRAPNGSPEACDIVVFRDDTPMRMLSAFAQFRNNLRETNGVRVIEVELNNLSVGYKGEVEPNRRYLASPLPGVYVSATSNSLMEVLIGRMKLGGKRRALPPALPEWQHVDLAAPAWAVRHYQRVVVEKDRTSMVKWDVNAIGLVLFCGSKPAPFVALRYISSSGDAGRRFVHMRSQWLGGLCAADEQSIPPLPRVSADAVEDRRLTNVPAEKAIRNQNAMSVEATNASIIVYLPFLGFGPEAR